MKNNNNFALVITIMFLLTLIVTATYSYFAAVTETSNSVAINIQTPGNVSTFITEHVDNSMTITASQMQQSAASSSTPVATTTGKLIAKLTSTDGSLVSCTFNIKFKWNTSTTYTKSSGATTEFTYKAVSSCAVGSSGVCPSGTTTVSTGPTQIGNIGTGNFTIASATLKSNNSTSASVMTTNVTLSFYNLPSVDQDSQKGLTYSAKIFVEDVVC